jgi:hypothetical protein
MADATDLINLSTPEGNPSVNGVKVGETLTAKEGKGGKEKGESLAEITF